MVVAPEHPFVSRLTMSEQKEAVDAYVREASLKSDLDRTELAKTKNRRLHRQLRDQSS